MKDSPLTLDDLEFKRTQVDVEEIKRYKSDDQFMSLGVELLKEIGVITRVISSTYRLDAQNNPRKWTRNEAIVGGLMVRLTKLQRGVLASICQRHMEIAYILFRCLAETVINLKYLLVKNSTELCDAYVEYSLRQEKRLLSLIDENIRQRGYEIPIEAGMKRSITRAFETSGVDVESIEETRRDPWGENVYRRAKALGLEDGYLALFGLPSHSVHGNWQDLISYHLEYRDGEFEPCTDWGYPRPEPLLTSSLLSGDVCKSYLDNLMPDCDDKAFMLNKIDDFMLRTRVAYELYEQYSEGNRSKE